MSARQADADIIAAIVTPPGKGGVGVIRVSGDNLKSLVYAWFGRMLPPRHAVLLPFHDDNDQVIDEGLAIYFPAPHSYTGQDVLELHAHGNPVILAALLRRSHQLGARAAQAGEFTLRAYLNDKMDLAQAESVADLIAAGSESAARSAVQTLQGNFSRQISDLVDQLVLLRTQLEAILDFPDEEVDFIVSFDIINRVQMLRSRIQDILLVSQQGKLLRDGLRVVLVGQPNVGKSSLLNMLAGDDVAIVSEQAGTTRDALREMLVLRGVPVQIIDTAGLRDTSDPVERKGIEKSWQSIKQANLCLLLVDAVHGLTDSEQGIIDQLPAGLPRLLVHNKCDLLDEIPPASNDELYVSAKTGFGIEQLQDSLLGLGGWQGHDSSLFMARERHLQALRDAGQSLELAEQSAGVLELLAEHLRVGQQALNTITGEFGADDLLGEIFSHFCIGK